MISKVLTVGAFIVILAHIFLDNKSYCEIRHPQEAAISNRKACEQQHIIQQQSGGHHTANVIWINTIEHDYADRSSTKPWQNNRPWLHFWGDQNLESAFMMGTYANGYHFQVHDYRQEKSYLTLFEWDGASHAVYVVSNTLNHFAKLLSYMAYQFRSNSPMYVDAIIGILIDSIELFVGVLYGLLGIVVGTIWNPIDTIINLIPAFALIIESTIKGVANTLLGGISVITLGTVHWVL